MPSTVPHPTLRVIVMDDHPISRCSYAALLRSESVEVLAELAARRAMVDTVRALHPDLVIVDVRPGDGDRLDVARQASELGPAIVLTSSARPESFGSAIDGFTFIAKADICRAALTDLITSQENPC